MRGIVHLLDARHLCACLFLVGAAACSSAAGTNTPDSGAAPGSVDGGVLFPSLDAGTDSAPRKTWPKTRFASKVVSFTPGPCAGYGAGAMPDIVLGPPVGYGGLQGSTDVLSLGYGGEIVLSVEPNVIVDGPGADFIVFENAFYAGGNPTKPFAELGEVSVSADGTTWYTFPCTNTSAPYGTCAGWHPVYSAPDNDVSPIDPGYSGGDPFDLAGSGVTEVRFIRIRDKSTAECSEQVDNYGFDLDAIAVVNGTITP